MKYKNVFNAHIEVTPKRILEPGAVIDLTDEDLKNPMVKKLIYEKNWLAPLAEQAVTGITDAELTKIENEIAGTKPEPEVNNYNFNVNFPIGHDAEVDEVKAYEPHVSEYDKPKLPEEYFPPVGLSGDGPIKIKTIQEIAEEQPPLQSIPLKPQTSLAPEPTLTPAQKRAMNNKSKKKEV